MDRKIGCITTGLTQHELAELCKYERLNISSNNFLSILSSNSLNERQLFFSIAVDILKDGIVLPVEHSPARPPYCGFYIFTLISS